MELNLPIFDLVASCKNLLVAGMGGGFDIFCGLPIYFELIKRGQQVHLANFSFSDIEYVKHGVRLSDTLVGITGDEDHLYPYFPEYYLSQWFHQTRQEEVPIWCFHKTGADPLLENYRLLVDHLNVDGILLIDGGVDSLVRGDESAKGTVIEDATSMYAVAKLDNVPTRLMSCIGFGAEQDMTYTHILENIAALTRARGFLGSCALAPQMESYQAYEAAVLYVQGQHYHDPSVINSSIISAVRGHFGNFHLTEKTRDSSLWISPLMSLYWFFSFDEVIKQNMFLDQLEGTQTFYAALQKVLDFSKSRSRRLATRIPL